MGVIIQSKFAMRLASVQPAWRVRDHREAAPRSGPGRADRRPVFGGRSSMQLKHHIQFEEILRSLEEKEFFPALIILTRSLQADALAQYHSLAGDLREAARRNAAFLTVAYRALDRDIAIPEMVQSEVTRELALIEKHAGFAPSPIFIYDED